MVDRITIRPKSSVGCHVLKLACETAAVFARVKSWLGFRRRYGLSAKTSNVESSKVKGFGQTPVSETMKPTTASVENQQTLDSAPPAGELLPEGAEGIQTGSPKGPRVPSGIHRAGLRKPRSSARA